MVMAEESEFHVLAVDDSLLDRKLIERLLRTSSYQVTTVDSGSKALEFLGVHDDENTSPESSPSVSSDSNHQVVEVNLVITDYCMPGMTGYDLLKKIKESSSLKNIPVVIMSSENVPSRISRCLEEGAEEFFLKPVRQSDLNRLKPHMMKTKLKDRKLDRVAEEQEERPEVESETQQQQQQQHLLSNNNTTKRKSIDETLSPDRTRPRYADIAAVQKERSLEQKLCSFPQTKETVAAAAVRSVILQEVGICPRTSNPLQQVSVDESVLLRVTHSHLKTLSTDVRFSLQTTVELVKEMLWKKCGTSVDSMSLKLYDDAGSRVCRLDDGSRPLGFCSPFDGYQLHIIDLDLSSVTKGGWLEDTSLVEKYTISEEAYNKLDGTFRKFKESMASQNPTAFEPKVTDNYMEELCANIKVGDRCEVESGAKRGIVKFVGRGASLAPGFWVGFQYDKPLGKHDGMVNGTRYFECPPLLGATVGPDKVKVGDYPERDIFEEYEI